MTSKLSQRVCRIKPSPTLAVTARAKALRAEGKDIIGLGAGEPDFDTPDHIKAAAIQAINDGMTKYTPVDGTPALKQAIVEKFSRDNDLEFSTDQVLVSCGGKQSFFNLTQALLDAGDEVIIPAPYWVSYPDIVLLADATPVIVDTTEVQGFRMSAAQLEAAITDNTRLLVLNSPSNPTGSAYTLAELIELSEVLLRYPQVMIATDDMYEHILWRDEPFTNIVNANAALMNRTIVLNGVSKAYSMTGWRIGYAAGPADLISAMKKIQSQSTSNPASISQAAAVAALNGDQGCIAEMVSAFRQRHDYLHGRLNALEGVSCLASEGTFYAFANMQGVIERIDGVDDDVALAEYFLNEIGVAMVPGSAFGAAGFMRLSYATSMDNLEKAMDRIETLQKSL